MTDGPVIEAVGLRKQYGDFVAVSNVDLAVERGQILGVLGPNGAGKSTTVRMLTTMTRPDGGHGRVAGLDIVRRRRPRSAGSSASPARTPPSTSCSPACQNLVMVGELPGCPAPGRAPAAGRAARPLRADRRRRPDREDATPVACAVASTSPPA